MGNRINRKRGQAEEPYWGQSFRIDFLICQLEDINPKGLTLIMGTWNSGLTNSKFDTKLELELSEIQF
jgi:hypothetical protein